MYGAPSALNERLDWLGSPLQHGFETTRVELQIAAVQLGYIKPARDAFLAVVLMILNWPISLVNSGRECHI